MRADVNKMRHRLCLKRSPVSKGTAGAPIAAAFSEYAKAWGEVCDLTATQLFVARQSSSEITSVIRIRFRTGISPNDRVEWIAGTGALVSPRTFSILAVRDEDGLRKFLTLDCKELSNGS